MRLVSALAARRSSRKPRADGRLVWWPRIRFSQSEPSRISPCRCRSSGMKPTPASRRAPVDSCPMSCPGQLDPAAGDRPDAHDGVDQFGLAVALDPGDAQHLAGVDRHVDVGQQVPAAARSPATRTPASSSTTRSVTVDSRSSGTGSAEPTIISASCRLVTDFGSAVPTVVPAPDDGDLVGDGPHLVELVRDEDDRQALGLELAQVAEQLVDLLRDQHGGRLVQDQDLGAAVEHLEDLHPLPGADARASSTSAPESTTSPYRRASSSIFALAPATSSRPPDPSARRRARCSPRRSGCRPA